MPQPNVYYTLPRGRGRLQQEFEPIVGAMGRSITPDRVCRSPCNSRPPTPPPFSNPNLNTDNINQLHRQVEVQKQDENYNTRRLVEENKPDPNNFTKEKKVPFEHRKPYIDKRTGTYQKSSEETLARVARALVEDNGNKSNFRPSLEEQLSPVSPETPTPKTSLKTSAVLDWCEEVEMYDKLEQEASDALTRSSSVTSLLEKEGSSKSLPSNKERRTPRRCVINFFFVVYTHSLFIS